MSDLSRKDEGFGIIYIKCGSGETKTSVTRQEKQRRQCPCETFNKVAHVRTPAMSV